MSWRRALVRVMTLVFVLLAGAGQTLACTTPVCCLATMDCSDRTDVASAQMDQMSCAGACIALMPANGAPSGFHFAPMTHELTAVLLPTSRHIPPATPPPDKPGQFIQRTPTIA